MAERHGALLLVVEQAAGRADEQVGNALDGLALQAVVDASEDRQRRQARMPAEDLGVGADLGDELARGRDDEGPGAARVRRRAFRGAARRS